MILCATSQRLNTTIEIACVHSSSCGDISVQFRVFSSLTDKKKNGICKTSYWCLNCSDLDVSWNILTIGIWHNTCLCIFTSYTWFICFNAKSFYIFLLTMCCQIQISFYKAKTPYLTVNMASLSRSNFFFLWGLIPSITRTVLTVLLLWWRDSLSGLLLKQLSSHYFQSCLYCGCGDGNTSWSFTWFARLWSRLKCLYKYGMDRRGIWYIVIVPREKSWAWQAFLFFLKWPLYK